MSAGWNLTKGDLSKSQIEVDQYWNRFNYLYSEASKKRSSYKFGLVKAIIDNLHFSVRSERGMELTYEQMFEVFTEKYWNLIAKYEICQIRRAQTSSSKIEKLIYDTRSHYSDFSGLEFENINPKDRVKLISQVKKECCVNVIGALYADFKAELYGFNHKEERIWLHVNAFQFLKMNKKEIEQKNYYAWAEFMNSINKKTSMICLMEKTGLTTPPRNKVTIYYNILRNKGKANNNSYFRINVKDGDMLMKRKPEERTISEAIELVLDDHPEGLTDREIYDSIVDRNLYSFNTKRPIGVVHFEIRKRCTGVNYKYQSTVKKFCITREEAGKVYYGLLNSQKTKEKPEAAYYVCFQNCLEDYYSENAPSLPFADFDGAIRYLTGLTPETDVFAPDVQGPIRWFFANCGQDGVLYDPDPDIDILELYQIINIIPGNEKDVEIDDCYCDDKRAIISMRRYYCIDCNRRVSNVTIDKIIPCSNPGEI